MGFFNLLYRFLLYPLSRLLMGVLSLFNGKVRKGLKLRKASNGKPWLKATEGMEPLWIHCSSGELEYAKPVIREIKARFPGQKIMVTFFSPSVQTALEKLTDIDFFCPMPWDTKSEMVEFIKHHKPKALLIARTDLWPMMIQTCRSQNVPTLLFSKTVNINKGKVSQLIESKLLKQLSEIFCATEQDRSLLLKQLGNFQAVHAAGDTRYDQCLHRITHPRSIKPLKNFHRKVFIAGSSWAADEKVLLPIIPNLIKDISFIIAPHEPSEKHLKELEKNLSQLNIKFTRYSQCKNWGPSEVLIIDQVGILADLYSWAEYAFIGGSMNGRVHSVMEPLAQGCLTFVGPTHTNNREAMDLKQTSVEKIAPVQVFDSSETLEQQLTYMQTHWNENHKFQLQKLIQKKSGASKIVLKWIEKNT